MSKVTLFCPSGAVRDEALRAGLEVFQDLGFCGEIWPGATDRHGTFAGSHDARAERLMNLLGCGPGHLWMVRGGYGAIHTLDRMSRPLQSFEARPLWGFSDGTVLLAAWIKQGWPAWHAPPITQLPRLDDESRRRLKSAFFGDRVEPFDGLETLYEGTARGAIAGGNLTVLASMVGTPHAAQLSECILLLEDVGESAYRVDRMITQLKLAGSLDGIKGLLLGHFTEISDREVEKIKVFFSELSQELNVPCAWGLPVGHGTANCVIPMGRASGLVATLRATSRSSRLEFGIHG